MACDKVLIYNNVMKEDAVDHPDSRALKRLYEKKADWTERLALAVFGSLVLGPIVSGSPLTSIQFFFGIVAASVGYIYANYLLNKSK